MPCEFCSELLKLPVGIRREFDKISSQLELRPVARTPAEHMIIENLIALTRLVVKILAEQTPTGKELYGCTNQCKNPKPHEHTVTMDHIDYLRRGAADYLNAWQKDRCQSLVLRNSFEDLEKIAERDLQTYRQENGI